jgi:hypothetical protein
MLNKIKTLILSLSAVLVIGAPAALVPATAMAASADVQNSVCYGADQLQVNPNPPGTNCANTTNGGVSKINTLITQIINVFSVVVGIVAVIMIIYAGFRYITSGGASDKVGNAKNTILYALIGLVIVALSQLIVKFVLNKTTG